MKSLFEFKDYKEYLRAHIKSHATTYGYKTHLARAAGCQKSFLSTVLNGPNHLTPDHAAGISLFLKHDAHAEKFWMELVGLARAATPRLREMHLRTLARLKQDNEDFSRRISEKVAPAGKTAREELRVKYYSRWYISALHILLTIPEFQSAVTLEKQVRERWALTNAQMIDALTTLTELGLIARDPAKKTYRVLELSVHLPRTSPLNAVQNDQWRGRARAVELTQRERDFFYSGIYSLSRSDGERLRRLMIDFLEETRRIVGPSREEELVCVRCELFEV